MNQVEQRDLRADENTTNHLLRVVQTSPEQKGPLSGVFSRHVGSVHTRRTQTASTVGKTHRWPATCVPYRQTGLRGSGGGGFTRHACAPHLLSLKTDFGHATLNSPRVFSTHSPPGGPRRNTLDAFPANGSQDTLPERTLTHAHTHPARSRLLAFVRLKIHTSADISGIVYARHMDTHSAHI